MIWKVIFITVIALISQCYTSRTFYPVPADIKNLKDVILHRIQFDPVKCSPGMELSENMTKVNLTYKAFEDWHSCGSVDEFTTKRHYFHFDIDSSNCHIGFGKLENYDFFKNFHCGLEGNNGVTLHSQANYVYANSAKHFTNYGTKFGIGDVIGILVDMDLGLLTFYKNGVSFGTAINKGIIQPGEKYYAFVSLTSAHLSYKYNYIKSIGFVYDNAK